MKTTITGLAFFLFNVGAQLGLASIVFRSVRDPGSLPKGSNVIPFGVCHGFLLTSYSILPK